MTRRTEEITRFIPLTDGQRFWLRRAAAIFSNMLIVYVVTAIAFGLIILKKTPPSNPISWREIVFFSFIALLIVQLLISRRKMGRYADRATELLKLETQAVLYYLEPRATLPSGHVCYETCSVGPADAGTLRIRLEANFQNHGIFAIILPLRRNTDAELYILRNGKFARIDMSQMRLNAIEAHWSANTLSTTVLLADKGSSSAMEMTISAALQRLNENLNRLENANLDFLWHHMESMLSDMVTGVAGLRKKIAELEAERTTLVCAIVQAITSLSSYERLFRSWTPVKEIGMALVRTMLAIQPTDPEQRANVTVATAAFQQRRDKA